MADENYLAVVLVFIDRPFSLLIFIILVCLWSLRRNCVLAYLLVDGVGPEPVDVQDLRQVFVAHTHFASLVATRLQNSDSEGCTQVISKAFKVQSQPSILTCYFRSFRFAARTWLALNFRCCLKWITFLFVLVLVDFLE